MGDRAGEGIAYGNLGSTYDNIGDFQKAVHYYKNSVIAFDHIRGNLISDDEWKISLGSTYDAIYLRLWGLQFKQGKVVEALLTADHGRAQALNDLLELKFMVSLEPTHSVNFSINCEQTTFFGSKQRVCEPINLL